MIWSKKPSHATVPLTTRSKAVEQQWIMPHEANAADPDKHLRILLETLVFNALVNGTD